MAATPNIMIIIPAILLIHHNCFSLNFFLNKSIRKVRVDHHNMATIKTPKITLIFFSFCRIFNSCKARYIFFVTRICYENFANKILVRPPANKTP